MVETLRRVDAADRLDGNARLDGKTALSPRMVGSHGKQEEGIMIKAQYEKRNHMLSIIDTNCSRTPTVSAKTGCVDLVFEDDETAIAVRDAIAAEHPFEPDDPPASAESMDVKGMRELLSELDDHLNKAMYIDLMSHRRDMGDVQFNLGRVAAYSNAVSCCKSSLMLMDQRDGTEEDA
jgi:hypothetical protein